MDHVLMRWLGLITGALLLACNPELHQRCDDGQACPNAFYCDGVWCFPDGVGPGPMIDDPDAAPDPDDGVALDATMDATADARMEEPEFGADVGLDGAPDGDVAAPLQIGEVSPDDRMVSRLAGDARDRIRIRVLNAERVHYGLIEGEDPADCVFGAPVPVEDGFLTVLGDAWDGLPPESSFNVCVRRGTTGMPTLVGPFLLDEIRPRIARLDRFDESAGVRFGITATEPLSLAQVFVGFDCERAALDVQDDNDDGFIEIERLDAVPAGLSVQFTDLTGNPSGCMDVRLQQLDCHDGTIFASGVDGIDRGMIRVLEPSCPDIVPDMAQLRGECTRCALLLEGNLPDDVVTYDHVEIHPRRATFHRPRPMSTRPGVLSDVSVVDAVRVDANTVALTDEDQLTIWQRANGRWSPRPGPSGLRSPIVVAADVSDNERRELIVGNYSVAGDLRLLDEDLNPINLALPAGSRLTRLIPFRPSGRGAEQLLGLHRDSTVSVFRWNGEQFDREPNVAQGVSHIAPLTVGASQGAAMIVSSELGSQLSVLFEGERIDLALLPAGVGCLATGDWTGDGRPDIAICEGREVQIYPYGPDMELQEPDRLVGISDSQIRDAVIGHTDFDEFADLVLVNEAGEVILVNSHPNVGPRVLDVPMLNPRLRRFDSNSRLMEIALLHPAAGHILRLRAVDVTTPPNGLLRLTLQLGERVEAVGDVDGDGADDLLVVNRAASSLRLLKGERQLRLEEEIELQLPPGAPLANTNAVTLVDVTGDGLPDVVGYDGAQLVFWFARPNERPLPFRQDQPIAGGLPLIRPVDTLDAGRDHIVVAVNGRVRRLELVPDPAAPTFRTVSEGAIDHLFDLEIGEVLPELEGLEFLALRDDPGEGSLVRTVFGIDGLADFPDGGERVAGPITLRTGFFAGRPHVLRVRPSGPDAEIVWKDDNALILGSYRDLSVGDLDGDGQNDLVTLRDGDEGPQIQLIRRDPVGDFLADVIEDAPSAEAVVTGDFDGDGWVDALIVEVDAR